MRTPFPYEMTDEQIADQLENILECMKKKRELGRKGWVRTSEADEIFDLFPIVIHRLRKAKA